MTETRAWDITSERDPLDWYIEVCRVCGCQMGPGIGSRTKTGRCIIEEHRSHGAIVVRVTARPDAEQDPSAQRSLPWIRQRIEALS